MYRIHFLWRLIFSCVYFLVILASKKPIFNNFDRISFSFLDPFVLETELSFFLSLFKKQFLLTVIVQFFFTNTVNKSQAQFSSYFFKDCASQTHSLLDFVYIFLAASNEVERSIYVEFITIHQTKAARLLYIWSKTCTCMGRQDRRS